MSSGMTLLAPRRGMTDLTGSLATIGLAPLLGFLSELGASGQLSIADGPLSGALYLEGGRVVGAVFGSDTGATAFESIVLLLGAGQFQLVSNVDRQLNFMVPPEEIERQLQSLTAERARLARFVPSVAAVPQPVVAGSGDGDEQITVDLGTLRLWLRFDGRRSVLEWAEDRSLLSTVRAVSRLVELGLVSLGEPDQSAPAPAPTVRAGVRPWSALDHRAESERAR
jgi:Domain of unknown function (DUF4388)